MFTTRNVSIITLSETVLMTAALLLMSATVAKCSSVRESSIAPEWQSQITISHLAASGLHGTQDEAASTDYRFRLINNMAPERWLNLSFGGGYALKKIDAPASAALPAELHSLFLEGAVTFRFNQDSFTTLKLTPGIYSDFGAIGGDDFRLPLLALAGHSFGNGITVTGGFIYRFGYHAVSFIPALGINWQPDEKWRVDLIMPRPGVFYRASRQIRFYATGDFSSDEYQLKVGSHGASALRYGDYKFLAGAEYSFSPQFSVSAAAGYAFERKFVFFGGSRQDVRLDDAPFVRLGAEFMW